MIRRMALAGVLACAASIAHAQQVYKWVDAQGRTHYGDKPTDGTPATAVAAPTPPSAPATANNPEKWKDMERDLRTRRLDRERAEEKQKNAMSAQERAARCEDARDRIRMLEMEAPVFKRDSNGDRVYFTDDERAAELRTWKGRYKEYCNS